MKFTVLFAAIGLAVAAGAQAQSDNFASGNMHFDAKDIDTNGDNMITKDEFMVKIADFYKYQTGVGINIMIMTAISFIVGLSIFTGASAAAALAPDTGLLIAARAIQGSGAAIATPLTLTLLSVAVPPALGCCAAGPCCGWGCACRGWRGCWGTTIGGFCAHNRHAAQDIAA